MRAYLKNYRQSPRKVRLVADLIKGKPVTRALVLLDTTPKRATGALKKLVESAIANAKNKDGLAAESLTVKEIRVDKGLTMRRSTPRAQGRATRIDKHTSNVTLVLEENKKHEARSTKSETNSKSKIQKKSKTKPTPTTNS